MRVGSGPTLDTFLVEFYCAADCSVADAKFHEREMTAQVTPGHALLLFLCDRLYSLIGLGGVSFCFFRVSLSDWSGTASCISAR